MAKGDMLCETSNRTFVPLEAAQKMRECSIVAEIGSNMSLMYTEPIGNVQEAV
jgi:hypothetical protein